MGLIKKYIKQKQYIQNNPDKVDKEKLEKHEFLKDEILMQQIKENDITNDITPFYDNIKKEVIKWK